MCSEALRNAGLLPDTPEAINVEALIETHFEARLDFGTELGGGVLGFTFFSKKGKPEVVGISPSMDEETKVSERRIRATLAHEAGHCMMHPILFMEEGGQTEISNSNIDSEKRRILCKKTDINPGGKYDGRWWEFQANCAIGGFLLPRSLVIQSVSSFTTESGLLGLATLEHPAREDATMHMAETFDVNPVVARIRLSSIYPEDSHPTL